eukprot:CAMPEP_0170849024 /NCGR_PEP_ID=MMETSP0734-20130129/9744_1 /TAXON_ID=186038 /ORGANISM="Fragilariopsis kerguelensis, Strain L26-C5" /LENGTH=78 /DNA_ID=CAMNT_0011218579 /DNA_START=542 /DNA_END=778 /DNA_ORIENTATION=+
MIVFIVVKEDLDANQIIMVTTTMATTTTHDSNQMKAMARTMAIATKKGSNDNDFGNDNNGNISLPGRVVGNSTYSARL